MLRCLHSSGHIYLTLYLLLIMPVASEGVKQKLSSSSRFNALKMGFPDRPLQSVHYLLSGSVQCVKSTRSEYELAAPATDSTVYFAAISQSPEKAGKVREGGMRGRQRVHPTDILSPDGGKKQMEICSFSVAPADHLPHRLIRLTTTLLSVREPVKKSKPV